MPDDYSNDQANKGESEHSASAIFGELLRQAAAKSIPGKSAPGAEDAAKDGPDSPESAANSAAANDDEISLEPEAAAPSVRRIRRRLFLPRPQPSSMASGFLGTVFVVVLSTALVATLLMFFVNPEYVNPAVVQGLQLESEEIIAGVSAGRPTPVRTPHWLRRIGIISGHRGKSDSGARDPGAICEDEYGNSILEEADINFAVATRVVASLEGMNYDVELLDEFDPRLNNYRAEALVSIHANTCYDFGEYVSGFIVAISEARPEFGADAFLRECIAENFGAYVPLERSYNLTDDMTDNHTWRKIHPLTPGMILEMGYMLADQAVLTEDPDLLARAIVDGILCFMDNVNRPTSQLAPGRHASGYIIPAMVTPTPIFGR